MGLNEKRQGRYEMNPKKQKTIVFVCVGNTCRSPMAEAILKSELNRLRIETVEVFSAGLKASGKSVNLHAAQTLLNKGLELANFSSKNIDETLLKADAIIAMTDEIKRKLLEIQAYGESLGKLEKGLKNVYSFKDLAGYEVADPYGLGEGEYLRAFAELEGGMSAIIAKFVAEKPQEKPQAQTPKKRGRPRGSKNKKPSTATGAKKPNSTAKKTKTTKNNYVQERIL